MRDCSGRGGNRAGGPRRAVMGATDHDGVCARLRKNFSRIGDGCHIAIGDDGNGDGFLHPPDGAPVCPALVELAARASMHRHHLDTRLLRPARQRRRIERLLIPPQTHLDGHRHLHRADHGIDQRQRVVEIAHQRRSGIAAGHLLRGTAHVDVDDVGALAFRDPRRFGHMGSLAPGQLDHVDRQAGMTDPQVEPLAPTRQFSARHHFGHDEPRPMRVGAAPERLVGDA